MYLSWIDDKKLFEAIGHVYQQYENALQENDLDAFTANTIDPFSLTFEMLLSESNPRVWIKQESDRQLQKKINQAVGEFHQIILGFCSAWEDLGIGDDSHLDIRKIDNSIFAEIKNKHNTMNANSTSTVYQKMCDIAQKFSNANVYLVQIVRRSRNGYDQTWRYSGNTNNKIRRISGDKFYEIATGRSNALYELYSILPQAIQEYIQQVIGQSASTNQFSHESTVFHDIERILEKKNFSQEDIFKFFFQQAYPDVDI
jgi:hypothetical protein